MKLEVTPALKAKWKQINDRRKREEFPELNFPLLVKTRNRIDEIPESYNQETWGESNSQSPCGTTACIAGEAVICSNRSLKAGLEELHKRLKTPYQGSVMDTAQNRIGLTEGEAINLFSGDADGWISKYEYMFQNAKTSKAQARAAVKYLDHIIKTGEITED